METRRRTLGIVDGVWRILRTCVRSNNNRYLKVQWGLDLEIKHELKLEINKKKICWKQLLWLLISTCMCQCGESWRFPWFDRTLFTFFFGRHCQFSVVDQRDMTEKLIKISTLIFIISFVKECENQIVYTKNLQDWDEDGKFMSPLELLWPLFLKNFSQLLFTLILKWKVVKFSAFSLRF